MEVKGETFAAYLAKQYVAKKGYKPGTVPEAGALASAADIVLTLSDGMRFEIVCIVDREADPGKRFGLSRDAVEAIGKACLKYSGKVSSTRLPVSIHVMEIGPGPFADSDRGRLQAFKRRGLFSKVHLSGWIVSTAEASVWTNAPFRGLMLGRRFIEGLLQEPRQSAAEMQRPAAALPRHGLPLLTFALLALLAAVFAGEIAYGVGPWTGLLAPDILTLIAMGGLYPRLVLESGEWYRVLTAPFLHGDAVHLLLNGVAL
jgi:rhomboid protease GluP